MKRLPLFIDDQTSLAVRIGIWALVPVVFVALLPILLLLVIALYFSAIFHGVRVVVTGFSVKQTSAEFETQGPHFLELETPASLESEVPAAARARQPEGSRHLRPESRQC